MWFETISSTLQGRAPTITRDFFDLVPGSPLQTWTRGWTSRTWQGWLRWWQRNGQEVQSFSVASPGCYPDAAHQGWQGWHCQIQNWRWSPAPARPAQLPRLLQENPGPGPEHPCKLLHWTGDAYRGEIKGIIEISVNTKSSLKLFTFTMSSIIG